MARRTQALAVIRIIFANAGLLPLYEITPYRTQAKTILNMVNKKMDLTEVGRWMVASLIGSLLEFVLSFAVIQHWTS